MHHLTLSSWARIGAALLAGAAGAAAQAALPVDAPAPDFTAPAALGGRSFSFSLAESLKKGPVVLYFYPKAFTTGCTAEAHDFAEATPKFNALGATVVGMSTDDIATLQKFSVEEVLFVDASSNPDEHVRRTMAAVEQWKAAASH